MINELFKKANLLVDKNSGMKPVPKMLQLGFFPGGNGIIKSDKTFDPNNSIEDKEIIIVGNNFGTVHDYWKCEPRNEEDVDKVPTWKNLLPLLIKSNIKIEKCFYTNVYMGLIGSSELIKKGNMGACPGSSNPDFVKKCRDFFYLQLEFLPKIKLAIVLGKHAPKLLMEIIPELKVWKNTFNKIDKLEKQIIPICNPNDKGKKIIFVILTHPSYIINRKLRRYNNIINKEKNIEVEILKDAIRETKIT